MNRVTLKSYDQISTYFSDVDIPLEEKKSELYQIDDVKIISDLAHNCDDEWIRLEAAIKCNDKEILDEIIKKSKDTAIILEAAIEIKNEKVLANLAVTTKLKYYGSMAIANIEDMGLLEYIVYHSKLKRLMVEAAIKLGKIEVIADLINKINDEWYQYQLAASINHIEVLKQLSIGAKNRRIKTLATEWLEDLVDLKVSHSILLKKKYL